MASGSRARPPSSPRRRPSTPATRLKPPLEYSILFTATLCLLAVGAVMVYSASSAESLLQGTGDPSYFLKRFVLYAGLGLVALHVASRSGLDLARKATPALLAIAFLLTVAVLIPGVGVKVNGASRWLGAGPLRFQPSEILKLALVLYAARVLASRPKRLLTLKGLVLPLLLVVGAAGALLMAQPDMGTAIVVTLSVGTMMTAAGARPRHLALIGGTLTGLALILAIAEPYRRERLTAFIDPWKDPGGTGFQSVQAMIAIGSGGVFGVGLGESVQKIFYLPEAHTDMILAIIGEEVGLVGILGVAALYGLIAYAGLRAARMARDRHAKLVAAGVTSLILCQAVLNLFAVMGLAPLTGVPLPFISFGNSNMIVLLGAMGVLLNVAATGGVRARPRAVPNPSRRRDAGADRSGRDGGARRSGAGHRRRAAG